MKTALVTGTELAADYALELKALGYEVINGTRAALNRLGSANAQRELTETELGQLLHDCSLYVYGGLEPATGAALKNAKGLELITFLGTGWSDPGCVDAAAVSELKIRVSNTPHANAPSVAEMAIALILLLERGILAMNSETKSGRWNPQQGRDISGRRLGIVGLGHIGSLVARHAVRGFGMQVTYNGPNPKPSLEKELGIKRLPLEQLLAECDYVSIHSPASTTRGLITEHLVEKINPGALVINLSAPEVVDGPSLLDALVDGRLRGAAFDGIYAEPKELRAAFLNLDDHKFIVLPRAAWLTTNSYDRMARMALRSIRSLVEGKKRIEYQVSPA